MFSVLQIKSCLAEQSKLRWPRRFGPVATRGGSVRRALLILVLVVLAMAALVPSAVATVHPQSRSECSSDAASGTPADTQNPPGITDDSADGTYTDQDPDHAEHARPVHVADEHSHKSGGCPASS